MAAPPLPSYLVQTRTSYLAQDTVLFHILYDYPNPNTGVLERRRTPDMTGTILAVKQTTTVLPVNGVFQHVPVVKYRIHYVGPTGATKETISANQITALIHRPVPGPTSGYILQS